MRSRPGLVALALAVAVTGCTPASRGDNPTATETHPASAAAISPPSAATTPRRAPRLPGMLSPLDAHDVYAADRPGMLAKAVRDDPPRIYVPNSKSGTVDVIDPVTYRIVEHLRVGRLPQHVVPSFDLRTLWVNNDYGNSLTPIDPRNGRAGQPVPVDDPYNLYFTPDGRSAVVMAEARRRIDFRDPHTMRLRHSLSVPCAGVNHVDFSADGLTFVATCEFSSQLMLIDTAAMTLRSTLRLPTGSMPQDIKLSPDGRTYYVADMQTSGVWTVDAATFRRTGFVPTGDGAHGLYVSRDSRYLYVANRGAGSISLLSFATGRVVRTWHLPGGGSPDMGGVSADGTVLWLSGRYHREVYAIDVVHWKLLKRIPVGDEPHGLCVFPQPGRYSLGHTGILR